MVLPNVFTYTYNNLTICYYGQVNSIYFAVDGTVTDTENYRQWIPWKSSYYFDWNEMFGFINY